MLEQLKQSIQNADKVVVGIGDDFAVNFRNLGITGNGEVAEYEKAAVMERTEHLCVDDGYAILKELLGEKDYYIISLNMDDRIFRTFDNYEKIVTPCGGLRLLQCPDACNKDLYEAKKIPGFPFLEDKPQCPSCQKVMAYNNLYTDNYLEEGYLPSWMSYQEWLKTTVNKKLCIVELGCSMKFPTIIRFAFDKLAMYNKKSEFYRVHESLWQHAKETENRGVSIKENALSFLCKSAK